MSTITGITNLSSSSDGATSLTGIKTAVTNLDTDKMEAATTNTLTNKTFDTAGTGNVLKINSTTISAKTGTGSVVLATSPTITTPAISSPTGIVKGDVGLGSVDNTSDTTKNAATVTLTNKRITARIGTEASSATSTPTADSVDQWNVTALAAADAFAAPTGTPTDGQKLIIRIKDNGTARALTWNAIYRASSDLALPTTTVISKTIYMGLIYNTADTKWDLVALVQNF